MTTEEDHRQMMAQLGITKLRPGASGSEAAPNAANYDEAKANPFPKLPEVLTLNDGTVLIGSSGEGGVKLHRRNFGEAVENLTGSGEYHWMAGNSSSTARLRRRSVAAMRATCPWTLIN